jgi:hypothetical protein
MRTTTTLPTARLLAPHAAETPEAKLITSGDFVAIHPLCADITHDSSSHMGR